MQRFLPTLPCIDPQAITERVAAIEGGVLSDPVWLLPTLAEPEQGYVALANRGQRLQWESTEGLQPQATGDLLSQCFSGTLRASTLGEEAAVLAAEIGEQPQLACSLGKDGTDGDPQLLIATASGCILWLGEKSRGDPGLGLGLDGERAKLRGRPITTLLEGCGEVCGMCVSQGARRLYLSLADGTLATAELDLLENGVCSPLRMLGASGGGGGALACDCVGNLYLCGAEGVQVYDDEGEAFLQLRTPEPTLGCCFGGSGLSRLFVAAGDSLWAVDCNVQGATPPSEMLLKQMEKLGGGDDFRHDGW